MSVLCRARGVTPYPPVGGGGGSVQARPGPRLWSRVARTSLRGGRASGPCVRPRRAGPAILGGGGGGDALAASWISSQLRHSAHLRAYPAVAVARRAAYCSLSLRPPFLLPYGRSRGPGPVPVVCRLLGCRVSLATLVGGGGGGREPEAPRLADRAAAAGTAPRGLLAALRAFFPVEEAPPRDQAGRATVPT